MQCNQTVWEDCNGGKDDLSVGVDGGSDIVFGQRGTRDSCGGGSSVSLRVWTSFMWLHRAVETVWTGLSKNNAWRIVLTWCSSVNM